MNMPANSYAGPASNPPEDNQAPGQDKADQAVFDAFMVVIREKRDEAIKSRMASGIEQEWREDEEFYEGIDDANRSSVGMKPKSLEGQFEHKEARETVSRSTIFLNVTRPYCDAASARVADMLLPTDDRNWGIRPTPEPDLVRMKTDSTVITDQYGSPIMTEVRDDKGQPVMNAPQGEQGQPMQGADGQPMPPSPQQRPMTVGDMATQALEEARESAERAQSQIDDYLVECQYHQEVRMVIEDAARMGVGILKGPFPVKVKARAARRQEDGTWKLVIEEKICPHSRHIPPENFYPHGACGENIHNGSYTFERDDISARQLMDLIGVDGYLEDQIYEVLKEGPVDVRTGAKRLREGHKINEKDLFDIWYFHGQVCKRDLVAAGLDFGEDDSSQDGTGKNDDYEEYPAIVTVVNDRIIKVALSPLDTGEFPYDVMVWQKRSGYWAGIGVARQMRTCQRGLNAAARNLMDNAGLSAGPQIVVDRTRIRPADGNWQITPRKLWWTAPNADLENAKDAFMVVQIASMQQELLAIIDFFLRRAEDITGLPMLIQGQLGNSPDTVGGMNMLQNNASAVLRRIARIFDDRITEPHIGRYYEWLLLHGPDEAKGDFQIDARGSSALVERDAQAQQLMQMVGMTLNPAFGLDPEKVIQEALKSMKFDPKRLELDEEKKQALTQAPPPDPRIQTTQMTLQQKDHALEAQHQMDMQKMQFEAQQRDLDRQLQKFLKDMDNQLKAAEIAGQEHLSLEEIKATIARDAMKLRTQRQLTLQGHAAQAQRDAYRSIPQTTKPPTEPAGRAATGHAFEQ